MPPTEMRKAASPEIRATMITRRSRDREAGTRVRVCMIRAAMITTTTVAPMMMMRRRNQGMCMKQMHI